MANDARRVGTAFESDVVAYARGRGLSAQRLARTGRLDEGDIFIDLGAGYIIECKARRDRNSSLNLGAWLEEAHRESANYQAARSLASHPIPILVCKNPGKPIGKAFVIQELGDWIDERTAVGTNLA